MIGKDPNDVFIDLHRKFRRGDISRETYDKKLNAMLILNGKIQGPINPEAMFRQAVEVSNGVAYTWSAIGISSIGFHKSWKGASLLNGYPRHVRQAARLGFEEAMTEDEATKLHAACLASPEIQQAVLDDLLTNRAFDIVQKQGPVSKRAVNIDERYQLGDNPDLLHEHDLVDLMDRPAKSEWPERER